MQGWGDFEAYNEGLRARLRGEATSSCPYLDTTVRWAIWKHGWAIGSVLARRQAPARADARP